MKTNTTNVMAARVAAARRVAWFGQFRWIAILHKKEGVVMEKYSAAECEYSAEKALDEFCRATGYDKKDFYAEFCGRICRRQK